ncbi:hypothetical protein F511_30335 [Dorcoceras hygrometricum]|uniref:C2H2-type domain-containing protein n=1 Tax=Dorcoceras hygrometricum TaxID=472368 RepID=A0A2Z7D6V9_9LAMI|nr:hypothetical protein F511_30335 [Dorcoceras hygrometricum]
MEDSGEGKPAEAAESRETTSELAEEMDFAPDEEMKSLAENDFSSGGAGQQGGLHRRSFPEAEDIKKHYCKECDKVFSCGKALGGHMSSAHAQANKGIHGRKKDFKNLHKGMSVPQIACRVCGKRFRSNKSLYGHMKNHPERKWRGVSPPPEEMIESSPPSSPQRDMSDPGPVLAWSVTAKRGRAASKNPDFEHGVHVAAHQLLQLLNSNPGPRLDRGGDSSFRRKKEFPAQKGLKICERGGRDEEILAKSVSKMIPENGKGKAKMEEHDDYSCIKGSSSSSDDCENNSNVMFDFTVRYPARENGKEEVKSYEPGSSRILASSHREYSTGRDKKAATWSKQAAAAIRRRVPSTFVVFVAKKFDNHKALGGHMASHNRFKICIFNANGKPTYVAAADGDVTAENSEQIAQNIEQSDAASEPGGGGRAKEVPEVKVESKVLDFDLNESPRCDEDE